MDPQRFDTLVRTLTTADSRRTLLQLLAGALVGTALLATPDAAGKGQGKGKGQHHGKGRAARPRAGAAAKSCAKKCRKKKSKSARRRCRTRCQPPIPACTTSQDCPAGELCESGICIPIPDQCATNQECDQCERCESGVCLTRCQPNEVCQNDQCVAPSPCTGDGQCGVCERCTNGQCVWRCQPNEQCQGGQCVPGCTPTTCAAQGTNCGTIPNGCGRTLDCGDCTAPNTCGGGDPGTPNQCGCTKTTCTAAGAQCGTISDGCDGQLDCGGCPTCQTCEGGQCVAVPDGPCCNSNTGICVGGACAPSDRCGCTPPTCPANANCGNIANPCGAPISCGTCTAGSTTPLCVNNVCTACSASRPCPSGCCASDGSCQSGTGNGACGAIGGTCEVCEVGEACQGRVCVALPCGQGGVCRVFVTSSRPQGNLGGLAGADNLCQGLATAAGLPGTYKAWLSDDTGSPSTRFVQSTGPYRLVTGTTIANTWADLTDGSLLAPINRTETGAEVASDSNRFVWTNTTPSGTLVTLENDCVEWTSNVAGPIGGFLGQATATNATWTQFNSADCAGDARLYCFQQS